jgi:hypothetical protein
MTLPLGAVRVGYPTLRDVEPPPLWYRYYHLREALDGMLVHSVSPEPFNPSPLPHPETAQPASRFSPLGAAGRNRLGRIALITR